jgi:hypothetical protein
MLSVRLHTIVSFLWKVLPKHYLKDANVGGWRIHYLLIAIISPLYASILKISWPSAVLNSPDTTSYGTLFRLFSSDTNDIVELVNRRFVTG